MPWKTLSTAGGGGGKYIRFRRGQEFFLTKQRAQNLLQKGSKTAESEEKVMGYERRVSQLE